MASRISNKGLKRTALSIALGMCFASSVVLAQSTSGGIFGAVEPGSTVTVSNNAGINRTITADANGRYAAGNLPVGTYTVTAGGVQRQVLVTVGGNANVSFVTDIGTVTVSAANVPPIDVTSTDTRTIITAEELRRIPIPRTAESIALLAPGAVPGTASSSAAKSHSAVRRSLKTPTTSTVTSPATRSPTSAARACRTARSSSRKPTPAATAPSTAVPPAASSARSARAAATTGTSVARSCSSPRA